MKSRLTDTLFSAAAFFYCWFLCIIFALVYTRHKSPLIHQLFWSESMKTYVDIDPPPDLQLDLGTKSGFINLMVKFMAALKHDSVLIKWEMLGWISPHPFLIVWWPDCSGNWGLIIMIFIKMIFLFLLFKQGFFPSSISFYRFWSY